MKLPNFNHIVVEEYIAVNALKNPFMIRRDSLGVQELTTLITQYSLFPKNIVSFLVSALYNLKFYGLEEASEEITRNINEELGHYPCHNEKFLYQPHYVILRREVLNSLNTDLTKAIPSEATSVFLSDIKNFLDVSGKYHVYGSVFALECSAVPELTIVFELFKDLFKKMETEFPKNLSDFFTFHIEEIELGHRARLLQELKKEGTQSTDIEDFVYGFRSVMSIMDRWWLSLDREI